MKKKIQLVLSALLGLALMFTLLSPVANAALTETTAAQKGAEVFEAWNILNYTSYRYMMDEYVSPYRAEVESRDCMTWDSLLLAWRIATFDVKSEASYAAKEVGYYDAFLFNILYDENSQDLSMGFVDQYTGSVSGLTKEWKSLSASTWEKICKFMPEFLGQDPKKLSDGPVKDQIVGILETSGELENVFSAIGDATTWMDRCTTVLDLIQKLSKVEVLLKNTESTAALIRSMADHTANDPVMHAALLDYADILSGAMTEEQIMYLFAGVKGLEELSQELAGAVWKQALSLISNTYGAGITVGQAAGKFLTSQLFNSAGTVASYYKIRAMYRFEDAMKAEMKRRESAFNSNPTPATAKAFIAAYKLMMKTYVEGLDCSTEWVESAYEGGFLNKLFNGGKYESIKKSIASIKKSIQVDLGYIDELSYNHYLDVLDYLAEQEQKPSPADDTDVVPVVPTYTIDDYEQAQDDLKEDTFLLNDQTFEKDTVLTDDRTTYGSVTVKNGTLDLNGFTLTVYGDLIISGGTLNLNGGNLDIHGNMTISGFISNLDSSNLTVHGNMTISRDISLLNSSLTVHGNVLHTDGTVTFNHGSLTVDGDYRIQSIIPNSAGELIYTSSDGALNMQYTDDALCVGGDFVMDKRATSSNTFSAGTMEVNGNFSADNYFYATGTHTLILNGTTKQTVSFSSSSATFQNLKLDTAADVEFSGYLKAAALVSGGTASSSSGVIAGLGLNGHSLDLTGDVTISGSVNLLNSSLIVHGNILHDDGTVTFNHGSLTVDGDYRMQRITTNSAEEPVYTCGYGILKMQYPDDSFRIGGNFVMDKSGNSNTLSAGTMEVKGDFRDLVTDWRDVFAASGSHIVILSGTKKQTVSFSSASATFQNLKFDTAADVEFSGYLSAATLVSDGTASSKNVTIEGLNLNGHSLDLTGDITIHNNINLLNGSLTVHGNVLHTGGTVTFNHGRLITSGEYRMQGLSKNSAGESYYSSGSGALDMQYADDYLHVGDNYVMDTSNSSRFSAGTMEIGGDFKDLCTYWKNIFDASGTHTVILNGTKKQTVSFSSSSATFQNLKLDTAADVEFSGYLKVAVLVSDGTASSNGAIINGLDLNVHSLDLTGDVTIQGNVSLLNGSLTVHGNILHSSGTVTFNHGSLIVDGDYRLQSISKNSAGEDYYTGGSGHLNMRYADDLLRVAGSMYVQSGSHTLTAGTLEVAGDFTQFADNSFAPSGTHTTILNGTGGVQHITFASSSSHFNILELTRDGSWYVFSPDKCWKSLKETPAVSDVEVTNISLSARTKTLTVGDTYQLTAVVYPENATNRTLTWTSSSDDVATVDQNGLVTALAEGTATIRAAASNGLYRTCTVTVHEIFSGTFSVGSVSALPGTEVAVPVTVWDNPGFAAMRVTMTYDASLLTPTEVRCGERLTDHLSFEAHSGSCNVLWYDSENMVEDGILFYLVFKVSSSARLNTETTIGLTSKYGDICRADHTNISFSAENGTLFIKELQTGDIYEDGVINVHDILLLQRYLTQLEQLSSCQLTAADLNSDGTVDMKDIVKLAQTLLAEPLRMQPSAYAAQDGSFVIRAEDAQLGADGFVNVPVSFSGCPGMAAFRLQIDYDTELLELVSIDAVSELVKDTLCDNLEDSSRKSTVVTWYSAADRKLDRTIFSLRFKLKDASFSGLIPISLTHRSADLCTAALAELPADVEHGLIHSAGYTTSLQIIDAALRRTGNSGTLTGSLVCGQELDGTSALALVAFYDHSGRLLSTWVKNISLHHGGHFDVSGTLPAYLSVKLFIMNSRIWTPLCPNVIPS